MAGQAKAKADKEEAEAVEAKAIAEKKAKEADNAAKVAEVEAQEAKEAKAKAKAAANAIKAWYVCKSFSVTSLRGIIGPGEVVSDKDFTGGETTLKQLAERGIIELTNASGIGL